MNKLITIITLFAVMLAMLITSASVAAQESEMNPAEVVSAVYAAVGEGDIELAVTMLADDAVLVLIPPPEGLDGTFIGKEEIGAWFEGLAAMNGRWEFSDVSVTGNTATMKLTNYLDFFENLGISPAEFDCAAVVQDGLWKSVSFVFTPEFNAKMNAAMAVEANKEVIRRYLNELWNEGNLDIVDELIAEDFVSHTFPAGEGREFMREMVTGFRAEFPGVTIILDEVVMSGNRAFVVSHNIGPDGEFVQAEEELGGIPDMLVFDLEDGQITDRWYFAPPE